MIKTDLIHSDMISNETYSFSFKVVHSIEFDIIVGRKTITQYDLWHLFPRNASFQPVPPWQLVKPKRKLSDLLTAESGRGTSDSDSVSDNITSNCIAPVLGNNITELSTSHEQENMSGIRNVSPGSQTQTPTLAVRVRSTTFHAAKQTDKKAPKNARKSKHVMAPAELTLTGSDDGYISDASNNVEKRTPRQLGTQQGNYRAIEGPRKTTQE